MATHDGSRPPGRIVVVGGGVAAQRCAFALRELGFEGALTMVGGEPIAPYDRTLLSKDLLSASETQPCVPLRPERAYADAGIDLRLGTPAVGLDADGQRVLLAGGGELPYDRAILCTGGQPLLPAALRVPGVLLLREAAHLDALRETLAGCRRLVLIGGGFIGGEVASSAVARGLEVTLVEAAEQPLAPVLGAEVGARVAALHRAHGVEVRTGAAAQEIHRGDRRVEVVLRDGAVVEADAVMVGTGMAPAVRWLEGSGLTLDHGVVTDACCWTDAPNVLAAGDCARWFNPRYQTLMRVEHWDTAGRHGAAAAAAALGADEPFAPLPFFWSDQHGTKLQWVGYAPSWDAVEIEDIDPPARFVARYWHVGRLVGVLAASEPRALAQARRAMQAATKEESVVS